MHGFCDRQMYKMTKATFFLPLWTWFATSLCNIYHTNYEIMNDFQCSNGIIQLIETHVDDSISFLYLFFTSTNVCAWLTLIGFNISNAIIQQFKSELNRCFVCHRTGRRHESKRRKLIRDESVRMENAMQSLRVSNSQCQIREKRTVKGFSVHKWNALLRGAVQCVLASQREASANIYIRAHDGYTCTRWFTIEQPDFANIRRESAQQR